MIEITAFPWVPPFAQGLVRDLRARWALEEAGLDYKVRLLGPDDQASKEYRAMQPFGQVPVYRENGLVLFESGSIVLHIAGKSDALMPSKPEARARMVTWLFAALNSIEPFLMNLAEIDFFCPDEEWAKLRRPAAMEAARNRLQALSEWFDGREYLADRFTAADLMMTTVLRLPRHTNLVSEIPVLDAYRQRCEARPAFQKALADQMTPFAENEPEVT